MDKVMSRMSNSIFNRLKISLSSGFKFVFINAVGATSLAAILTLLFKLDTPFLIGSNTEMLPAFAFIIGTFVFSLFLQTLGIILLNELNYRTSDALRKWRILSVIFLVLYGLGPILAEVVSMQAGLVINILHLSVGVPAIIKLPTYIEG
jgi:hypothetical protein|tara:strand:- start:189 stop:635 length:447 start_codon:yes stop_codon:yes gene_type:complete